MKVFQSLHFNRRNYVKYILYEQINDQSCTVNYEFHIRKLWISHQKTVHPLSWLLCWTISYLIISLYLQQSTCIVQIADKNHHLTSWNSNVPLNLQNCIRGGEEGYIGGVYCACREGGSIGVERKWGWGKCAEFLTKTTSSPRDYFSSREIY